MTVSHVVVPVIVPVLMFLGFICGAFGVYFILKAIWALREGKNERLFILRGLVGLVLLVFPWVIWGVALGVNSTTISSSHSTVVPIPPSSNSSSFTQSQ